MGGRPQKRPLPTEEASPVKEAATAGTGTGADAPTPTSAAGTPPSTSAADAAPAAATTATATDNTTSSKRQRKLTDADVATADVAVISADAADAAANGEEAPGAAKRKKKRRRSKGGGGGGGGGGEEAAAATTTTTTTDPEDDAKKRARVDDGAPIGRTRQAPTLAIALPGSAIDNTQSPERATALAGALARAAAIFCVDEVVVFDDSAPAAVTAMEGKEDGGGGGGGDNDADDDEDAAAATTVGAGAALLARILQFMETPQYLRRALVPMHPDLRLAGALPPLDAPHHARAGEWTRWREGVVVASEVGGNGGGGGGQAGSVVDVGLDFPALVALPLRVGARVTLEMGASRPDELAPAPSAMALASAAPRGGLPATLARPSAPRDEGGLYWGYTVRLTRSLAEVVSGSPHGGSGGGNGGGYDLTIGTSERGVDAREAVPRALRGGSTSSQLQQQKQQQQKQQQHPPRGPPPFQHALVVFGGPAGLEAADAGAPSMFDVWVNTCPGQGSRTIRTEEAVLVSLAALQPALTAARSVGGGFV